MLPFYRLDLFYANLGTSTFDRLEESNKNRLKHGIISTFKTTFRFIEIGFVDSAMKCKGIIRSGRKLSPMVPIIDTLLEGHTAPETKRSVI